MVRPISISCSIEVLCLPTRSAPAMRFSSDTRNCTPSLLAMVCASVIISAASWRVRGNWQMSASVEWVSALMGLKLRFPHSLSQISERMSFATGDLKPALVNVAEMALTRSLSEPSSSPTEKRLPSIRRITPGETISAAG